MIDLMTLQKANRVMQMTNGWLAIKLMIFISILLIATSTMEYAFIDNKPSNAITLKTTRDHDDIVLAELIRLANNFGIDYHCSQHTRVNSTSSVLNKKQVRIKSTIAIIKFELKSIASHASPAVELKLHYECNSKEIGFPFSFITEYEREIGIIEQSRDSDTDKQTSLIAVARGMPRYNYDYKISILLQNIIFWGIVVTTSFLARLRIIRFIRSRKLRCQKCGYSMDGLRCSSCPECGFLVSTNIRQIRS